jgi:hypothetical protein
MTDYAKVEVKVKIADNPELDPTLDHFSASYLPTRSGGYARGNPLIIVAEADAVALDFDEFALDTWLDLAVAVRGANPGSITLSDVAGDFTLVLPAGWSGMLRHYKSSTPGSPQVASTLGTKFEILAFGEPYVTPA